VIEYVTATDFRDSPNSSQARQVLVIGTCFLDMTADDAAGVGSQSSWDSPG
jgi:hypothetical protein